MCSVLRPKKFKLELTAFQEAPSKIKTTAGEPSDLSAPSFINGDLARPAMICNCSPGARSSDAKSDALMQTTLTRRSCTGLRSYTMHLLSDKDHCTHLYACSFVLFVKDNPASEWHCRVTPNPLWALRWQWPHRPQHQNVVVPFQLRQWVLARLKGLAPPSLLQLLWSDQSFPNSAGADCSPSSATRHAHPETRASHLDWSKAYRGLRHPK